VCQLVRKLDTLLGLASQNTDTFRRLASWLVGNRLRILMYHSVSNNSKDPHAVAPSRFEQQMLALAAKGHEVISLGEGLRRLQGRQSLRRYVVLTFDDAYRDFLTNALPVLERFGYPATLFVPTGLVGGTATWDSYDPTKPLMDWDELREVHRRGVTIASHTVTHARLTECDERQLEYELRASLDTLRVRLGDVFPALSYPGGFYGPRERLAARQAGYVCAVGVASRWGNGTETDPFALRREKPMEFSRATLWSRLGSRRNEVNGDCLL